MLLWILISPGQKSFNYDSFVIWKTPISFCAFINTETDFLISSFYCIYTFRKNFTFFLNFRVQFLWESIKKTMKKINISRFVTPLLVAFFLPLLLSNCSSSRNATTLSTDEIQNMVNSSRFIFVADRLTTVRGTTRYLTNYYYVNVTKDKLSSFLPFLGRIYHPLLDPTNGPLRFTSTRFTYNVTPKNKNGWEIIIKPQDNSDVQQLRFEIFDNGSTTLDITSLDRDAISFAGRIEKLNE